jgi:LacI family transcriptional regulator
MVTIYDLAKETGFSAPTVSKALNGTGHLSAKTRDKILEVARKMGYEPNLSARTLSTKKSHLIGVVYDDPKMKRGFDHPLFSVILNRFREQVERAFYDIIFLSHHSTMTYTAHAAYRTVDGVAIINPELEHYDDFKNMASQGMPCVSTNDIIPGVCTLISKNEEIGYKATEYLIENGHKRIGYLSGPWLEYSRAAVEREEGYMRCLKDHGIGIDKDLVEECKYWHMDSGYEGFSRLYKRAPDITAVFVCADLLAMGVYKYADQNNLSIPQQISIVSVDDDRVSSYLKPSLSTFRQDGEGIADMAAEMLMNQIAGLPVPPIVRFDASLMKRNSVFNLNGKNEEFL